MSLSDARTVSTDVWFSFARRYADESNAGAAFVFVEPVPDADQSPVPSSFVARTWAWYDVPSARPVSVAVMAVPLWPGSVHPPLVPARYCTS